MSPRKKAKTKSSPGLWDKPSFPLWLYAALAFLAFSPCLLTGNVYYSNDLLYFVGPMMSFLKDQLSHGHFPLWNPYLYGGQPFFADQNVMMAYPPNYLALLFPTSLGLTLFMFFHMVLGACGAHFWLKSVGLSRAGCILGGLIFSLSGFFWFELIHPPVLAAFGWLPWFFGSLEKLARDLKPRHAFTVGLTFALMFLGNLQVTLGALYVGLFYFLFRMNSPNPGDSNRRKLEGSKGFWGNMPKAALFMVWGSVPLFFQLIPSLEFSKFSTRLLSHQYYENFNSNFSFQPATLYQFLFPAIGLDPGQTLEEAIQKTRGYADADFLGNAGYLGVWVPFLMLLALSLVRGRLVYLLSGAALLSLLVSFGKYFFLHQIICALVPGFSMTRAPYRFLFLYVLCSACLAALGYEALEKIMAQKTARKYWWMGISTYCLVLAAIPFMLGKLDNPQQGWREIGASLMGLAGIAFWRHRGPLQRWGKILFLTAVILPLILYGWSAWIPADPGNFDFESRSLASKLPLVYPGRVFINPSLPYELKIHGQSYATNFPVNSLTPLKIRSSQGYNPLRLQKVSELSSLPFPTQIGLMNIEEILTDQELEAPAGFQHEVHGSFHFYKSTQPLHVTAPNRIEIVPSEASQLDRLRQPGFSCADQAVLSGPLPPEIASQLTGQKARVSYGWTKNEPDSQIFTVQVDAPTLAVFSEVNYPGWKAFLDGKPVELFTANYVFRSLFIPAGNHEVEFEFLPVWFHPLLWMMVLWCLSAILYGAYLLTPLRDSILDHYLPK